MIEEKTIVYLTPEDAEAFINFQKHFSFIQILETLGVFQIRNGSVTINFDGVGRVGSVDMYRHFKV
jgi:hypothetical protein